MISHASLNRLSGNICTLHPSPRPTAHPCTTHRTLSRRSILTHKRRTPCTRKPTLRILRARLPPSHEHPRLLLPHSNSPHITITLDIITPQLHSHARASPLRPLNRRARSPTGAARRRASRVFILAGRVYPSLHYRYASRWRTGYPSGTAACTCS
jgi:hypothetical protein